MSKDMVIGRPVEVVPTKEDLQEQMQQGLALIRAENDMLQMAAARKPRDLMQVKQRALQELQAFPKLAEGAWYSIPYKQRDASGRTKTVYVEGPSVKSARRLAQAWGNLSVGARIVDATDDRVVVEGVALDLETAYRYSVPVVVSRLERNRRTGQLVRLPDDRWHVRIQSAMAKAVRNAIFGVLPEGFVAEYVEKAKEIAEKSKKKRGRPKKNAGEELRQAIISAFEPFGITEDQIKALAEVDDLTKMDEETRVKLRGLVQALKDGQVTVQEVLSTLEEEEEVTEEEAETLTGTLEEEEEEDE